MASENKCRGKKKANDNSSSRQYQDMILSQVNEMFDSILDPEIIMSVVESCDWKCESYLSSKENMGLKFQTFEIWEIFSNIRSWKITALVLDIFVYNNASKRLKLQAHEEHWNIYIAKTCIIISRFCLVEIDALFIKLMLLWHIDIFRMRDIVAGVGREKSCVTKLF